jgi:thymidylate synthase ThyX
LILAGYSSYLMGMRVQAIATVPPPSAGDLPKVTPELLASVLARYSRSNQGIETILEKVDMSNPDKSIDQILKFVDYGHASIGGLTGGIAVTLDGVSMWLATKMFEIAQLSDGQESSTRYITLDPERLPDWESFGLPEELQQEWKSVWQDSMRAYQQESARLDEKVSQDPHLLGKSGEVSELVFKRLKKNYALDRARYFIPFATSTNIALVMTARMWAETIRHLASLPQPEAQRAAQLLRSEVARLSPRLTRHSQREESFVAQAEQDLQYSLELGRARLSNHLLEDQVHLETWEPETSFLEETQGIAAALQPRANRYGRIGRRLRRMSVAFAWNNIAVAELRDLNRHRTGHRICPMIQAGFYLPPEVPRAPWQSLLDRQTKLLGALLDKGSPSYVYGLLLGSQTPFEHVTQGDKFLYEAELRTGLGAHFRYADHLRAALHMFYAKYPEARGLVLEGDAEPE